MIISGFSGSTYIREVHDGHDLLIRLPCVGVHNSTCSCVKFLFCVSEKFEHLLADCKQKQLYYIVTLVMIKLFFDCPSLSVL